MDDPHFFGNRVWRIETPDGPLIQKLYRSRRRWPRELLRASLTRLAGAKSSPLAAERRATERRLLARWAEVGADVPAELSARHPELAGPDVLLLEYIDGAPLLELLKPRAGLPRAERDVLLAHYGRVWRQRHDLALELADPGLIQEHGSLAHVLVAGERLVHIDLEQAFRPGRPVMPLLAKEVVDTLRSMLQRTGPDVFPGDLDTLIEAYDHDDRLAAVATEYLDNPRPTRRLLWALDRRLELRGGRPPRKYRALEMLTEALRKRASPSVGTPA